MEPVLNPLFEIKTTRTKIGEVAFSLPQSPHDWPPRIPEFVKIVRPFFEGLDHERLLAVYFTEGGQMTGLQVLAEGGRTSVECDVVEIVRSAIVADARALVLVHNHPFGDSTPSETDIALVQQVAQATNVFRILVADEIVLTDTDWTSVREHLNGERRQAIIRGDHVPEPNEYDLRDPQQRAACAADLRLSAGAQSDPNFAEALRTTAAAIEGKVDPFEAMMRIEANRMKSLMGFDPNGDDGPGGLLN